MAGKSKYEGDKMSRCQRCKKQTWYSELWGKITKNGVIDLCEKCFNQK